MARGACARLDVDVAVATTGIAGPDGGSAEKPVGLVWLALASAEGSVQTRRVTFPGNRAEIRERATVAALSLLWRFLEGPHEEAAVLRANQA
jgi:PncC family amidohydrolase